MHAGRSSTIPRRFMHSSVQEQLRAGAILLLCAHAALSYQSGDTYSSLLSPILTPAIFVDIAVSDYIGRVPSAYQQLDIYDAVHWEHAECSVNNGLIMVVRVYWSLNTLSCPKTHAHSEAKFYLPPTCLSTFGMKHPALLPSRRASPPYPHPAVGRRLSWPGWLGKDTGVVCPPKTVTHTITNQARRMSTLLM